MSATFLYWQARNWDLIESVKADLPVQESHSTMMEIIMVCFDYLIHFILI